MLFKIIKNSQFLQNLVSTFVSFVHPAIEHNIGKIMMLKKAFYHVELEGVEGGYFEFGVYEGNSMHSAIKIYEKLKGKFSNLDRSFYGFDSFDEGFKYFDKNDEHHFFKTGDFKSSYNKVKKRLKKFPNAHLIKGYFEEVLDGKDPKKMLGEDKCSIIFIDCDLMSPAMVSLNFIGPILQEGSVIILDDFFAYKGSSEKGVAGAFNKFLKESKIKVRDFGNYGHGGKAFVVSEI